MSDEAVRPERARAKQRRNEKRDHEDGFQIQRKMHDVRSNKATRHNVRQVLHQIDDGVDDDDFADLDQYGEW